MDEQQEPVAVEKRTVEAWALAKGMLPREFPAPERSIGAGVETDRMGSISVPLGQFRGPRSNPNWWMFHAARAGAQWPEGKEVTEAEFDAAVALATTGHQMR